MFLLSVYFIDPTVEPNQIEAVFPLLLVPLAPEARESVHKVIQVLTAGSHMYVWKFSTTLQVVSVGQGDMGEEWQHLLLLL